MLVKSYTKCVNTRQSHALKTEARYFIAHFCKKKKKNKSINQSASLGQSELFIATKIQNAGTKIKSKSKEAIPTPFTPNTNIQFLLSYWLEKSRDRSAIYQVSNPPSASLTLSYVGCWPLATSENS